MRLQNTPRRQARRAFTLMEMLVVVAIIVVLAGTGGYLYMQRLEEAKVDTARAQVKIIETACESYKLQNGEYPPTLEALTQFNQVTGGKPFLEADKIYVPWSNGTVLFGYDPAGPNNSGLKPDVYFIHPDSGNAVGNWNLKAK